MRPKTSTGAALSKQYLQKVKQTLCLPTTTYPVFLKHDDRIKLDKRLHKECGFGQPQYDWQQQRTNCHSDYVILDGPPYANGRVHVGHAINKIIKDVFARFKAMTGYRVHFKPGWDCHGLPIELKALNMDMYKSLTPDSTSTLGHGQNSVGRESRSPSHIATTARSFANEVISHQASAFESWGVSADWRRPYLTDHPEYIAKQLQAFVQLYNKGLVYREFKPVYWSPSSRTALAQAELEYNQGHVSQAVYVKFPLWGYFCPRDGTSAEFYLLIWTTTPWTLPLNDAVFFNPAIEYVTVKPSSCPNERWILAKALVDKCAAEVDDVLTIVEPFTEFRNVLYRHPFAQLKQTNSGDNDYPGKAYSAAFVSQETGTGIVHGSFAHGFDDFKAAKVLGLSVSECFVDDDGRYTQELNIPGLAGKCVLSDGNQAAIDCLASSIVAQKDHVHSYPYDWRTKKPVVVKASKQWFVDVEKLRPKAMELLEKVNFQPQSAYDRMVLQLRIQPDWCISRQRVWGVPIPVFYDQDDRPVIDQCLTDYVAEKVKQGGVEEWWNENIVQDIPRDVLERTGATKLTPGRDIFDIWFDSGVAWYCSGAFAPKANLVIEGHDQFRGWLNSLLLTSVGMIGRLPYESVVVHGFALDAEGRKMSKSLGNVVNPEDVTSKPTNLEGFDKKLKSPTLGVDGLRYWAAWNGLNTGIYLGDEVLKTVFNGIKVIRGIVRFVLGSIHDLEPGHETNFDSISELDRWILFSLANVVRDSRQSYHDFDLPAVTRCLNDFLEIDFSSIYISAVKDRLYCDAPDSLQRRTAQTTLKVVLETFLTLLNPILPHLTEEYCLHRSDLEPGDIYKRGWPVLPSEWNENEPLFLQVLPVRQIIAKDIGAHTKLIDKNLVLSVSPDKYNVFRALNNGSVSSKFSELCDFFSCARVDLLEVESIKGPDCVDFRIEQSECNKCLRCRRFVVVENDVLCSRCAEIVKSFC